MQRSPFHINLRCDAERIRFVGRDEEAVVKRVFLSTEDHNDGEQHDVPLRLRVSRAGENRLRGVRRRFQVRQKARRLHLRH